MGTHERCPYLDRQGKKLSWPWIFHLMSVWGHRNDVTTSFVGPRQLLIYVNITHILKSNDTHLPKVSRHECNILPFWFIFISPIIFDIIDIFDIFWNPQMKTFFIRNFRFFFRKSPKSKIDQIFISEIKLSFVHDFYFFMELFSEISNFLSDWFRYIFHKFTFCGFNSYFEG